MPVETQILVATIGFIIGCFVGYTITPQVMDMLRGIKEKESMSSTKNEFTGDIVKLSESQEYEVIIHLKDAP
ncbi:MAG: hypothetical protein LBM60_07795 [Clostridium sp.]|jgi:hypothetical protein|nr:hypothetical protein [Clostridium sp.]